MNKKMKNSREDRFNEGCIRLLYDICCFAETFKATSRKPPQPLEQLLEEYFPYSALLEKKS
ncbi:MAG: hypothetical protein Q7T03_03525 [Deltaproteobacteria bacterium]|nr:hypothetical protein [Deltaproteobacteria bacterium]